MTSKPSTGNALTDITGGARGGQFAPLFTPEDRSSMASGEDPSVEALSATPGRRTATRRDGQLDVLGPWGQSGNPGDSPANQGNGLNRRPVPRSDVDNSR
jgi:hypothetical protein